MNGVTDCGREEQDRHLTHASRAGRALGAANLGGRHLNLARHVMDGGNEMVGIAIGPEPGILQHKVLLQGPAQGLAGGTLDLTCQVHRIDGPAPIGTSRLLRRSGKDSNSARQYPITSASTPQNSLMGCGPYQATSWCTCDLATSVARPDTSFSNSCQSYQIRLFLLCASWFDIIPNALQPAYD